MRCTKKTPGHVPRLESIAELEKRFGIMPLEVGWADWVGKIIYFFR